MQRPCCATASSAVTQISLIHHTHEHAYCLLVLTIQQFVLSCSQYWRSFKGTAASDSQNTVILAGCESTGAFKGKHSFLILHYAFRALTSEI